MICFALSSCKGLSSVLQLPSYAKAVASLSRNDCDSVYHLGMSNVDFQQIGILHFWKSDPLKIVQDPETKSF